MRMSNTIRIYRRCHIARICLISCLALSVIGVFHSGAVAAEFGTLKGTVTPAGVSAKVQVKAIGELPAGQARRQTIEADTQGGFHISLPQGLYQLSVMAEGYVPLRIALLDTKAWSTVKMSDIGIRVLPNEITDVGCLVLEKAGFISGHFTSDDPKDLVGVFAVRRTDQGEHAYDLYTYGQSVADPETGDYRIEGLRAGVYDISVASRKYGVKCFVLGCGPILRSGTEFSVLQSRISEYGRALVSEDPRAAISFFSENDEARQTEIKANLQHARQNRSESDKEIVQCDIRLLSCSVSDERAVSVGNLFQQERLKATSSISTLPKEQMIHFWAKEGNVWKLTGWSWMPVRSAASYLAIHDFLNPSGREGPLHLGEPEVIFSDELVGIEVKAGETTLIPPYIMERSGIRPLGQ